MPRIAVKGADQLRKEHPREFSLLYEFGGTADGIDSQVEDASMQEGRSPKLCICTCNDFNCCCPVHPRF